MTVPYPGEVAEMVTIFATFKPKAGLYQEALSVLRDVLEPTRAEPGCLRFDLFAGEDRPSTLYLYEIFVNASAIDEHRRTQHYQIYRASIEPLLEVPPHAIRTVALDVVGGHFEEPGTA
jgi:quinol monooxygenase YgiN